MLIERWLRADAWQEIVVIWSYNFEPALVQADGFRTALPYRLVLAHPVGAWWEEQTGRRPQAPRRLRADDFVNWRDYNEALAAWHDRPCTPRFERTAHDMADGYTEPLRLATTIDNPYARVLSFRMLGCQGFLDREADREAVSLALWRHVFPYPDGELGDIPLERTGFEPRGARYQAYLTDARDVIDERIADGDWDPNEHEDAAALWDRADEFFDSLEEIPRDAPPDTMVDIALHLEASECSEDAAVLIDLRDGALLIVHKMRGC